MPCLAPGLRPCGTLPCPFSCPFSCLALSCFALFHLNYFQIQYQTGFLRIDNEDVERYDTTLTIPYNLKDGVYVLQWISLVGNIKEPYYSCVKLKVSGGNPNLNCDSSDPIPTAKCHRSGGPPMGVISKGTQRGNFCFRKDGVGYIDENIRQVPINVDCDPRITCQLSIWDGCKNELTGIEVNIGTFR